MASRLAINSFANALARVVSTILTVVAVPLYLRTLGAEVYGVIAFVTALQGMLSFLDLGLAATINREVARSSTPQAMASTIGTLESVYWLLALILFTVMSLLAGVMAKDWLTFHELTHAGVRNALVLSAVAAALRWPVAVYNGILLGLEQQITSNVLAISFNITRTGAGILAITLIRPSLDTLLIANIATASLEVLVMRWFALRKVAPRAAGTPRFELAVVSRVWKFALSAGVIGALGTLLANVDKVLLGRAIPLGELGVFSTIVTIAAGLPVLGNSVCTAAFPRLSKASAGGDAATSVGTELRSAVQMIFFVAFPALLLLICFGRDILAVVVGASNVPANGHVLLAILALGGFCNALGSPFYTTLLAHGRTPWLMATNCSLLVVLLPYYILLLPRFGVVAAALGWLLHNIILVSSCVAGCRDLVRRLVPAGSFIIANVGAIALFFISGWAASWIDSYITRLAVGAITTLGTMMVLYRCKLAADAA